jgi:hypothetical protein
LPKEIESYRQEMRQKMVTFHVIERENMFKLRGLAMIRTNERNLLDDLVPGLGCHMSTKHIYSSHFPE